MPLYKAAKEIDAKYYPDVAEAGNLQTAISRGLTNIGSQLIATSTTEDFIPYARVEMKARSSQIYIAEEQRLFLFDFWSKGVLFGNGSADDILKVCQAVHIWVSEQPSIEEMSSRFDFFSPTEEGKAHEAGTIIEFQWQRLLASWSSEEHRLSNPEFSPLPLIVEAMKHIELRQLYPYTSVTRLRFSRTTGFPFTTDCPFAEPIGNNQFRVHSPASHAVIGEGTVEEAIEMIIRHLPENYGAAINGTAKDL
jgi:hypothetical protein